ncbi:lysostaphin resistance A-like protein [Latilactobacillus sakei]|nr:type II CAAX endopeptidase family protein [Latilactobacillus sakei]SON67468.1 CAAX amino terminal protease family protein [Latilactobacillus sakei]
MRRLLKVSSEVVIALAVILIAQLIARFSLPSWASHPVFRIIQTVYSPVLYLLVFYGLINWLNRHYFHETVALFTWRPSLKPQFFIWPVIWILLIDLTFFLVVPGRIVWPTINHLNVTLNLLATLLLAGIAAPIVEEYIFRGLISQRLTKAYGARIGLIGSSLIFGLTHLLNGVFDFWSAVQLIIAGTLAGALFWLTSRWYQTLWAGIVLHAGYNVLTSVIPIDAHTSNDWPIQYLLNQPNRLMTGGEYGADCSLITMITLIITLGCIYFATCNSKRAIF